MAASDVAPSDDPFWPAALRRDKRLPSSLRVGLVFSVAAAGSLPEPLMPVAVTGSLLPASPCGGLGRVQRCKVVAKLVELRSKCSLDLLGIRGGELVLERENSLRPHC